MLAVIRRSVEVSAGRGDGMNGSRGPWSSARCATSRPWLTNGVEEPVVSLVVDKEKKTKKTPSLLGEFPLRLRMIHCALGCVLIGFLQTLPPL